MWCRHKSCFELNTWSQWRPQLDGCISLIEMQQRSNIIFSQPDSFSLSILCLLTDTYGPRYRAPFSLAARLCLSRGPVDGPCMCISMGIESCLFVCLCQRLWLCLVAPRELSPTPLPPPPTTQPLIPVFFLRSPSPTVPPLSLSLSLSPHLQSPRAV